jgi:hypothetical protein
MAATLNSTEVDELTNALDHVTHLFAEIKQLSIPSDAALAIAILAQDGGRIVEAWIERLGAKPCYGADFWNDYMPKPRKVAEAEAA